MDIKTQLLIVFGFGLISQVIMIFLLIYKKKYGNQVQKDDLKKNFLPLLIILIFSFLFIFYLTMNIYLGR